MTEDEKKVITHLVYALWDVNKTADEWDWLFDRWLLIPRNERLKISSEYMKNHRKENNAETGSE